MNFLDGLIARAKVAIPDEPGDFRNTETGLLTCGKCGGAKETRIEIDGEIHVVRKLCTCAQAERDAAEREEAERELARRIDRNRTRCFEGKPGLASFTFATENGGDPQAVKISKGYVSQFERKRNQGRGLLFLGGPGVGKSYLAACIANALLDQGFTVKFTTFPEIAARLQASMDKESVYKTLARYDLLILDDVGVERTTSFMEEIVFSVIDSRHGARRPVIATSNVDAEQFLNGGDLARSRILSRLYEMTLPVTVAGCDRRRERLAQTAGAELAELLESGNR